MKEELIDAILKRDYERKDDLIDEILINKGENIKGFKETKDFVEMILKDVLN